MAGSKNHLQVYQHASSSPRPREDVIAAPTNISLPVPLSAPHFDPAILPTAHVWLTAVPTMTGVRLMSEVMALARSTEIVEDTPFAIFNRFLSRKTLLPVTAGTEQVSGTEISIPRSN